jgi:hypothetical protein
MEIIINNKPERKFHKDVQEHLPVWLPFHPLFDRVLIPFQLRSKPLQIWDKEIRNGHIKRLTDQDIQSSVLEIMGTNVSTNFITCPADPKKTLGIKLPFLVMIIKNVPTRVSSVEEILHVRSAGS